MEPGEERGVADTMVTGECPHGVPENVAVSRGTRLAMVRRRRRVLDGELSPAVRGRRLIVRANGAGKDKYRRQDSSASSEG